SSTFGFVSAFSDDSSNIKFSDCIFENNPMAISLDSNYDLIIQGCTFKNHTGRAVYLTCDESENYYIKNNYFNNIGDDSIYISKAFNAYIFDNEFHNSTDYAVYASETENLYVADNIIQNLTKTTMYLKSSQNVRLRNNTMNLSQNNNYAVNIASCEDVTVEDNKIYQTKSGITLTSCYNNIVLQNNIISGRDNISDTRGINIQSGDGYQLLNNFISTFKYGIYGLNTNNINPDDPLKVYFGEIISCPTSVFVNGASIFNMYNVSFNSSLIEIGSSGNARLHVFYAVDVIVTDIKGPVGGALVTAINETGENEVQMFTSKDGIAHDFFIRNATFQYNSPTIQYHSPYNFSSNVAGDIANASKNYTIGSYRKIYISYDINTRPAAPINLRYEVNYSSIELHWECHVFDLKSYKVYRNKTGGGWDEIAHIISPPADINQVYTDVDNAVKFIEFTYKIEHIDLDSRVGFNDITVTFNDWVVVDEKNFTDSRMQLNGSLIVEDGGEFTLENLTLLMNGTLYSEEQEIIEVRDGGTLIISDSDGDNSTSDDMTIINASKAMGSYGFIIQEGGWLEMYNSQIQNASYFVEELLGDATGNSDGKCAIFVDGGGVEIYNSTLILTDHGVAFKDVHDSIIYGTHFENNGSGKYNFAISMLRSMDVYIENNTFNRSKNYEIQIYDSEYIEISNNTIIGNSNGIYIKDSNDIYIYKNTILYTLNYGIYTRESEHIIIKANFISDNDFSSIYSQYSDNLIIQDNIIKDSPDGDYGIYLYFSDNNFILGNTISKIGDFDYGIYAYFFDRLHIGHNHITNLYRSMYIYNAEMYIPLGSVHIYNNTIYDTTFDGYGMHLNDCINFYIYNNTINNSYHGIKMDDSKYLHHNNNNIFDCTYATEQYDCYRIYFDDDHFRDNDYGYYIKRSTDSIINNCTIEGLPPYTVYVNDTSDVTIINPYFNLSKNRVSDHSCRIELAWTFDLIVKDQFGIPQPNIFVRVRNVFGTILSEHYTDNSGKVYSIYANVRTQLYDGNLTNNPISFEAQLGNHQGTLQAEVNSRATLSMQLDNSAPSAYNIIINPLTPRTKDSLDLQYLFSDPELDADMGTIVKWYKNNEYQPSLDNLTSIAGQYTKKGEFWFCKVTPSDGVDFGYTGTSTTAWIYNTKPRAVDIAIKPDNPDSMQDLKVEYTFEDDDGDPELGTIYRWYVKQGTDFVLQETSTEPTLSYSKTQKGEEWKVGIEPKDGESSGDIAESDPIMIGNSPPSVENLRIIPQNPHSIDDLSIDYIFTDVDSDAEEGTSYRWYKVPVGGVNFIATEFIERTVPADALTKGERWKCEIIPSDGINIGSKVNSSEAEIGNSAPEVSDIIVYPEAPLTTDNLTVSYNYFDRDGDSENDTSFEWLKLSDPVYIPTGLKLEQLPSIFTTKGETWVCEIIPKDGLTYGNAVKSPPIVIGNSAPEVTELSITPDNPQTLDTLKINYNYFDENNDSENGSKISWYKNDILQPELDNKSSIDAKYTTKGDLWHFSVIPKDGYMNGEKMESDQVEILNSPPEIRSPKITNRFPRGDEDLHIYYEPYDPDNDPIRRVEVKWYMNGEAMKEYDDMIVISANATEKDQVWHFDICAYDGNSTSEYNESFPVTIRNSRPEIADYYPKEPEITMTETESVEFGVDVFDMDGDILLYQWVLEDQSSMESTILGEDEFLTLQTDYNSSGTYILNLTIQDWGVNSYKIYKEWKVTILNYNRLPVITILAPAGTDPRVKEDESLKFEVSYSDPDKEDDLKLYWYVDGLEISSAADSRTYTFDPEGAAGTHTVKVRLFDGYTNATKDWNISVKGTDEGADLIYGMTWDQWSVVLQALVIIFTAIFAAFGFWRLRKKKGVMHDYMKQVEAPMKNWQEDPDKAEDELMQVADHIEKDFTDGLIEDLHYFILERQIKENLREIRQEQVGRSMSYLPADSLKELEGMLEDGRISEKEYHTFLDVLSHSKELSAEEKEKVKKQLKRWRMMDGKREVGAQAPPPMETPKEVTADWSEEWDDEEEEEAK
ncbi:MAG: right-handed parallel beta-helix repeat-containing protein, partial [Thermoplasmata archaeon]